MENFKQYALWSSVCRLCHKRALIRFNTFRFRIDINTSFSNTRHRIFVAHSEQNIRMIWILNIFRLQQSMNINRVIRVDHMWQWQCDMAEQSRTRPMQHNRSWRHARAWFQIFYLRVLFLFAGVTFLFGETTYLFVCVCSFYLQQISLCTSQLFNFVVCFFYFKVYFLFICVYFFYL